MIILKSPDEIAVIKEGAKILAEIVKNLEEEAKPGITTKYLDKVASDLIFKFGAKPSFKNHMGFPAALCASVNEIIVHGIPSERKLEEGDLLSLDLGVFYKGFHSDMAVTVAVGRTAKENLKLLSVAKKALEIAVKKAKPGNTFGDIGFAIQKFAEDKGYNVVRELCGHGIGKNLHEDPQIPNYGKKGTGEEIKEGMVFCIEPMLTVGDWHIKRAKDGYGFASCDGSLSAHFEHTVAITKNGAKVLTKL